MFITQDVTFQEEYRSSEVLTRDNIEVLTFDYSPIARNDLHEEQPLQSSCPEYTTPVEGQQSMCCGDQPTKQLTEEQQTLREEEQPTGPTGLGLDNELQPIICNRTEQQLQQLSWDFSFDGISDPSINSSFVNSYNQSSLTPDAIPLRRLPERINRGIPKPICEADPKCKHKYFASEPNSNSRVRYPLNNYVSTCHLSESNKSFVYQLSTVSIPNTVQEALVDSCWKDAMNEELRSLKKNTTWEITDLLVGKKFVGCKWVYKVKYKADGTVDRLKTRLVAKRYTHKYGIDYSDTFVKINTVRALLSLTANLDWPLQQFNVKNAFLHGDLTEEIYMDLPPGWSDSDVRKQKVCRLKKSLYGLN
jgi:hypothetical protein